MASPLSERPASIFAPPVDAAEPNAALGARPICANDCWELVEIGQRTVRLTRLRKAMRIETLPEIMAPILDAVTAIHRPTHAILTDLRAVVGNNDSRFEQAFAHWRRSIYADWGLSVILCASEVGRMQLQRHMAEDHLNWRVLTDEGQALRIARAFGQGR